MMKEFLGIFIFSGTQSPNIISITCTLNGQKYLVAANTKSQSDMKNVMEQKEISTTEQFIRKDKDIHRCGNGILNLKQ